MPPRRKEVDESPVHLTAQQAKNLTYQTQQVPSFLRALHSKVNGSRNYKDQQNQSAGDELDDLVGIGSSSGSRLDRDDREGEFGKEDIDDEDEFEGAQIVVLKDGKHLSREELDKERKINPLNQKPTSTDTSSSISSKPGLPSNSKKRSAISAPETEDEKAAQAIFDQMTSGKTSISSSDSNNKSNSKSGMDEAKDLIAIAKKRKLEKEKEKEKKKEDKNKKARMEKKKSGKGLSFDLHD